MLAPAAAPSTIACRHASAGDSGWGGRWPNFIALAMPRPTSPPMTPQSPACHHGQPRSVTANTMVRMGAIISIPAEYAWLAP